MRWSKVRHLVKERFAPELAGRLDINSAAYGNCTCGHAWLTWDGDVIANFCTRAFGNTDGYSQNHTPEEPTQGELVGYGEFSRQDAYRACWAYLHDLSIDEALSDEDPLVNMLALADARVGRRRLAKLDPGGYHPVARRIFELRATA
ncbi:MAG: hypothetical protein CL808_01215 [Citromicrobium sp.]|nr:hypothetical protein [Citromicrobium sp.]